MSDTPDHILVRLIEAADAVCAEVAEHSGPDYRDVSLVSGQGRLVGYTEAEVREATSFLIRMGVLAEVKRC